MTQASSVEAVQAAHQAQTFSSPWPTLHSKLYHVKRKRATSDPRSQILDVGGVAEFPCSLTEDEIEGLLSFHSFIIEPLIQQYVCWSLSNFDKDVEHTVGSRSVSRTEKTRILRALYRFQMCCNIFGRARCGLSHDRRPEWSMEEIIDVFLSRFEPWEVEEIACVYTFAREKYDEIFTQIQWDVHEENPKFGSQRYPPPEGSFNLDPDTMRDGYLAGTISLGLSPLQAALSLVKSQAQLVSTMQKCISLSSGFFLEEEALGFMAQETRREEKWTERDGKEERRDPLPFQGDEDESPAPGGARPPLAWTTLWAGTYCNLYGSFIPEDFRRWGYVMWRNGYKRTVQNWILLYKDGKIST